MNSANARWFQHIAPSATNSSSTSTTTAFDTAGYDYLELVFSQGTVSTGLTLSTLALQEGDSSTTATTNITGAIAGTSTPLFASAGAGSNLPSSSTNGTLQVFNIDLKGRKRWMNLSAIASSSTGLPCDAIARLSRSERAPESAAQYGANQVFQVPQAST